MKLKTSDLYQKAASSRGGFGFSDPQSIAQLYAHENLELRDDQHGGVFVRGLTVIPAQTVDEVLQVVETGFKLRATHETRMNSVSSRSHTIFTFHVTQKDRGTGQSTTAQLYLVDLAGSERLSRSESSGQRLVEAQSINLSLACLGKVVVALQTSDPRDGPSAAHIPYRDSKLTRLLQGALGGNAYTTLLATVHPRLSDLEETLSTLQFANRCQTVLNRPKVNYLFPGAEDVAKRIRQLEAELAITRHTFILYRCVCEWWGRECTRSGCATAALSPLTVLTQPPHSPLSPSLTPSLPPPPPRSLSSAVRLMRLLAEAGINGSLIADGKFRTEQGLVIGMTSDEAESHPYVIRAVALLSPEPSEEDVVLYTAAQEIKAKLLAAVIAAGAHTRAGGSAGTGPGPNAPMTDAAIERAVAMAITGMATAGGVIGAGVGIASVAAPASAAAAMASAAGLSSGASMSIAGSMASFSSGGGAGGPGAGGAGESYPGGAGAFTGTVGTPGGSFSEMDGGGMSSAPNSVPGTPSRPGSSVAGTPSRQRGGGGFRAVGSGAAGGGAASAAVAAQQHGDAHAGMGGIPYISSAGPHAGAGGPTSPSSHSVRGGGGAGRRMSAGGAPPGFPPYQQQGGAQSMGMGLAAGGNSLASMGSVGTLNTARSGGGAASSAAAAAALQQQQGRPVTSPSAFGGGGGGGLTVETRAPPGGGGGLTPSFSSPLAQMAMYGGGGTGTALASASATSSAAQAALRAQRELATSIAGSRLSTLPTLSPEQYAAEVAKLKSRVAELKKELDAARGKAETDGKWLQAQAKTEREKGDKAQAEAAEAIRAAREGLAKAKEEHAKQLTSLLKNSTRILSDQDRLALSTPRHMIPALLRDINLGAEAEPANATTALSNPASGADIEALRREYAEAVARLKTAHEAEVDELRRRAAADVAALTQQSAELETRYKAKLAGKKKEASDLRAQVEALQARLADVERKLAAAASDVPAKALGLDMGGGGGRWAAAGPAIASSPMAAASSRPSSSKPRLSASNAPPASPAATMGGGGGGGAHSLYPPPSPLHAWPQADPSYLRPGTAGSASVGSAYISSRPGTASGHVGSDDDPANAGGRGAGGGSASGRLGVPIAWSVAQTQQSNGRARRGTSATSCGRPSTSDPSPTGFGSGPSQEPPAAFPKSSLVLALEEIGRGKGGGEDGDALHRRGGGDAGSDLAASVHAAGRSVNGIALTEGGGGGGGAFRSPRPAAGSKAFTTSSQQQALARPQGQSLSDQLAAIGPRQGARAAHGAGASTTTAPSAGAAGGRGGGGGGMWMAGQGAGNVGAQASLDLQESSIPSVDSVGGRV
jgi:hypothetical protein